MQVKKQKDTLFWIHVYIINLLKILKSLADIFSAEGYTNMTFYILCGINSKHSDI
jgi:hypothetical protein